MIAVGSITTAVSGIKVAAAVMQDVVDGQLEDAMEEVAETARQNLRSVLDTEDSAYSTGKLADDIHVEQKGPGHFEVIAGERDNGTFYGHLIEGGYEGHGRRDDKPPRPFLLPAFEEHRDDLVDIVGEAVEDVV